MGFFDNIKNTFQRIFTPRRYAEKKQKEIEKEEEELIKKAKQEEKQINEEIKKEEKPIQQKKKQETKKTEEPDLTGIPDEDLTKKGKETKERTKIISPEVIS